MKTIDLDELLKRNLPSDARSILEKKQQSGKECIELLSQEDVINIMMEHINTQYHGNIKLAAGHWGFTDTYLHRIKAGKGTISNNVVSFLNLIRLPREYDYFQF